MASTQIQNPAPAGAGVTLSAPVVARAAQLSAEILRKKTKHPDERCARLLTRSGFVWLTAARRDLDAKYPDSDNVRLVSNIGRTDGDVWGTLDVRRVAPALKAMGDTPVVVTRDLAQIVLEGAGMKRSVWTVDTELEAGPWLGEDGSEKAIWQRFDGKKVKDLFARMSRFISDDTSRPILTGVFMGAGVVVATDTHRMLKVPFEMNGDAPMVTVPTTAVKFLARHAAGSLLWVWDEEWISVESDDWKLYFRTVPGQYPDFNRVIPGSFAHSVAVDRERLVWALKVLATDAKDWARRIRLNWAKGSLSVSSQSDGVGMTECQVPSKVGPELTCSMNYTYLLDALMVFPGETVVLKVNDQKKPIGISAPESPPDEIAVVMPMIDTEAN